MNILKQSIIVSGLLGLMMMPNVATAGKHQQHAQELIHKAKTYLGLPYRSGGSSPETGFDCSGFMQYLFKGKNIDLPRSSKDMAMVGKAISRDNLKPGDMLFFNTYGSNISHVAMYIGDNQFIHSPSSGKTVEIVSLDHKYWAKNYVTARRVSFD